MNSNRNRSARRTATGLATITAVAITVAGGGLVASQSGAWAAGGAAASADEQPSLVEDYSYPNADKIKTITLKRGDGHIMLVDCATGPVSAKVYSFENADPFCFRFTGAKGFLSLELPNVYGIRNENYGLSATIKIENEDKEKTVEVPRDDWIGLGTSGPEQKPAVLLELRSAR
jgi:hypothetical protein